MRDKPPCEPCREIYKEKRQDPPCRDCLPELDEENEDPLQVYMMVRNQVIVAGDKIVDLNLPAVIGAMDVLGVGEKKRTLEMVLLTFRTLLDESKNG